jgi:hypothetical protein
MTKLLIISPQTGAAGMTADIIVIAGDYAGTPVKALQKASLSFQKPVVLIAGLMELDGTNRSRLLAEGRRQSKKYLRLRFLERDATTIEGVRFIGMHKPDVAFILAALDEPHDGPNVIVTYDEPRDDIEAVTMTGKVTRWIHAGSTTTEPLVVEV